MCREVIGSVSGPRKPEKPEKVSGYRIGDLQFSDNLDYRASDEEILKNQKILKVTTRAELIIHNTCAVTGTISFFSCGSRLRLLRTELTVCSSKNCSSL